MSRTIYIVYEKSKNKIMSLSNKYLNNTILARYNGDTVGAPLSKTASNLLVSFEEQGYKIINTKDFYPNTVSGQKYACYDSYSLSNFLLYHDTYFQLAFEKFFDIEKVYKAIVRNFLLKVDGSIWVKQIVYAYPRSIFTLSDSDRAAYTKQILIQPKYDEFVTYYSSIYALTTTSPSLPMPCTLGIGSGCFVSELQYFSERYNKESDFGSMNDNIVKDRTDLINGFYYLAGEDLTLIAYPVSNNYIYNNSLYNKLYSTGQAPIQQGPLLHYIADNQTIKDSQTFVDTLSLSPGDPLQEPSSTISQTGNGGSGDNQVSTQNNVSGQDENDYISSGYSNTPAQYGNPNIFDGISPEELGYYSGPTDPAGFQIFRQLCPPGFASDSSQSQTADECQCNKVI